MARPEFAALVIEVVDVDDDDDKTIRGYCVQPQRVRVWWRKPPSAAAIKSMKCDRERGCIDLVFCDKDGDPDHALLYVPDADLYSKLVRMFTSDSL